MPVEIKRRLPQSGRIRIGRKGDRGQPMRLETFRLTSPDERLMQQAAAIYGGEVHPWKDREGEYELITDRKELPVLVTPEPLETWYELWSAAGCQRRCDGDSCTVPDGKGGLQQQACMCDPDRRDCQLKTRVNFLLPDLAGIGVWRLDTGSYFTAAEMPGQVELLHRAAAQRQYPEADLAIEPRTLKTRDERGKPITRKFPVATLRIRMSLRELFGAQHATLPEPQRALPAAVNTDTGEVVEPAPAPATKTAPRAPATGGALNCTAAGCGKVLTKGQHDVSVRAFGQPLCPACQKQHGATNGNGGGQGSATEARGKYFGAFYQRFPETKSDDDLRRCTETVLLELEQPLQESQRSDWTAAEWAQLQTALVNCNPDKVRLKAKAILHEAHAAAQSTAAHVEAELVDEELPNPFFDDEGARSEPATGLWQS